MVAKLAVFLVMLGLVTGCGSINVVTEAKSGGTIALRGAHGTAREKAEKYMRAHCPNGFEVVEEGDTIGDSDDAREWRIAYRCVGSPSVAKVAF